MGHNPAPPPKMGVAPRTIGRKLPLSEMGHHGGREIHAVQPTNYRKHNPCPCADCYYDRKDRLTTRVGLNQERLQQISKSINEMEKHFKSELPPAPPLRQGVEERFTRAGGSHKTLTPPDPYEGLSYYDKWNRVYDDTLLEVLDEVEAVRITDELVPVESEPTLAEATLGMAWMAMPIVFPILFIWAIGWNFWGF